MAKWCDIDLARMAAYIDGEGSITICESNGPKYRQPAARMLMRVNVGNTDIRLAQWCKEVFGGYVVTLRPRSNSFAKRNVYFWQANAKLAAEVLEACLPFFIIKREQAELALQFRKTYNGYGGNKPIPDAVVKERTALQGKLVQMHKTGVA